MFLMIQNINMSWRIHNYLVEPLRNTMRDWMRGIPYNPLLLKRILSQNLVPTRTSEVNESSCHLRLSTSYPPILVLTTCLDKFGFFFICTSMVSCSGTTIDYSTKLFDSSTSSSSCNLCQKLDANLMSW